MIIWKHADELYIAVGGVYTYLSWFVFVGQVNDIHKTIVTTHNMLTWKVFARCLEPLLQNNHTHVGWAFAQVFEYVKLIETHIKWKKSPSPIVSTMSWFSSLFLSIIQMHNDLEACL